MSRGALVSSSRWITAAAALTALVTACGSSASPSSSQSGSAKPTKGTISIMSISQIGTDTSNTPEVLAGVQAAALAFNKSGGVDGYKVNVIFCNSMADATGTASCAREAVSDHVVAVVGDNDSFGDSLNPILQAAGIPRIGNGALAASDYTSPISFPLDGSAPDIFDGAMIEFARMGISKQAVIVLDVPPAQPIAQGLAAAAKTIKTPNGTPVSLDTIEVPLTAADYTPYAQALHTDNAGAVIGDIGDPQLEGVMSAAKTLGYQMDFYTPAENLPTPDAKTVVGLGQPTYGDSAFPPSSSSAPAAVQYRSDMSAAQKGGIANASVVDDTGFTSWVAMQAFKIVAQSIKGSLTAKSLLAALDAAKNVTVPGVPGTWTPIDPSRPAAESQISVNSIYWDKLAPNATWALVSPKPINVATLLAGS